MTILIANSKMLVEMHGGRIHLQSKKDVGTILRFFIRVKRSTACTPPSKPELVEFITPEGQPATNPNGFHRETADSSRRLRILVVEVCEVVAILSRALTLFPG
jgi:hypothetical protein